MKEEEASNTKEGSSRSCTNIISTALSWASSCYTQNEQEASEMVPEVQKIPPKSESKTFDWTILVQGDLEYVCLCVIIWVSTQ